jgi:hypothetical protein
MVVLGKDRTKCLDGRSGRIAGYWQNMSFCGIQGGRHGVVIERCDASLAAPSTQRGSDAGRLSGGVD